jgi:hypothetical protein
MSNHKKWEGSDQAFPLSIRSVNKHIVGIPTLLSKRLSVYPVHIFIGGRVETRRRSEILPSAPSCDAVDRKRSGPSRSIFVWKSNMSGMHCARLPVSNFTHTFYFISDLFPFFTS